jgi:DNA-binding MarR family transcriptional regulator
MLSPWEFRFLSYVLGNVTPFLGCSENLAHTTLEVVNSFPRQPVAEFFKGPMPVNTIGPIVDLTPGSISIAIDRLVAKSLVSRVESAEDRRVRIVALTPRGRISLFPPFESIPGR